ncbi:MAG: glycosyltransferase, partial [Alistipes sp.]|nr:glycosyltransferase [Alistipes sp.]
MTPSISVIAPVYKTEKFLKTCLDSILAQTFSDWELIAVDDCSPDGSSKILDRFARRDPRIRVVTHPVNRGVSQARFTGLEHATGRYVVFVDSDDWMPRNALRALHDKIESTGADMVIGSMVKTFGPRSMIKTRPSNSISPQRLRAEPIVAPELMERYFLNFFGVNLLPSNMCGKIYRRSTLSGAPLAPVPFSLFEDMIFNMTLHPWLTKIGFVTDTVYCYRFGGGSSTS